MASKPTFEIATHSESIVYTADTDEDKVNGMT